MSTHVSGAHSGVGNVDESARPDRAPENITGKADEAAGGHAGWLDRLCGQVWLMRLVLVVVAAACFWPGQMTLPPTDRDESRFVQATKQMVTSGDYVDIRFQEEPRYKKPAGIHWLQAASVQLHAQILGNDDVSATPIWVYRIPSLIGAILAVLFTHAAGTVLFGARVGFIAGLLMASTIMLGIESNIAKTDAVLLATIVAAQAMMARWWMADERAPRWTAYVFWIAVGAGFLVKGPIILMVVGLTLVPLAIIGRRARWLLSAARPIAFLLGLAIAVPWYVLIYMKAGTAFFEHAVGTDLLGKVATGQESHGAPPGIYVLAAFGTLWPVVAFVPETIGWIRKRLFERAVLFCVCWIVPTWLAFELIKTKLPHYVLPTYPAFAILVAAAFAGGAGFPSAFWRRVARLPLLVAPLGLVVAIAVGGRMLGGSMPWFALAALTGAFAICAVLWYRAAKVGVLSALALSVATALSFTGVLQLAAPTLERVWISNAIVARAEAAAGCPAPRIVTVGYNEPSLVFLSGGEVAITAPSAAADAINQAPCQLLVVDRRFETEVVEAIKAAGFGLSHRDEVLGLNYNGGDELELQLYRIAAAEGGGTE